MSCQPDKNNSEPQLEVKNEDSKSIDLGVTMPLLTNNSNSEEIRNKCESTISIIDNSLSKLEKFETKLTFNNVADTPVTIWYANSNMPVKIEHSVTDDFGKFTDKFHYYFIDGQLWYSNQIFARYIFNSGKLLFWMDENWGINNIPSNDFKNREIVIKSNVEQLLAEIK
jgi:hypothetical protein